MNRSSNYILSVILFLAFLITGCDSHDHSKGDHGHDDHYGKHAEHDDHSGHSDAEDHHGHEESEIPAAVITHFNDYTELSTLNSSSGAPPPRRKMRTFPSATGLKVSSQVR